VWWVSDYLFGIVLCSGSDYEFVIFYGGAVITVLLLFVVLK